MILSWEIQVEPPRLGRRRALCVLESGKTSFTERLGSFLEPLLRELIRFRLRRTRGGGGHPKGETEGRRRRRETRWDGSDRRWGEKECETSLEREGSQEERSWGGKGVYEKGCGGWGGDVEAEEGSRSMVSLPSVAVPSPLSSELNFPD